MIITLVDALEADLDIVAVHGLFGNSLVTWTHPNGEIWLKNLLPAKFPRARILTYQWVAPTNGTLYEEGIDLASALSDFRERTQTTGRKLVFIAHDLGGVLVKAALIHSRSISDSQHMWQRDLFLSTKVVEFLCTPHQRFSGEEVQKALLKNARKNYGYVSSTSTLPMDEHTIEMISEKFMPIWAEMKFYIFREHQYTGFVHDRKFKLVIPETSIQPDTVNFSYSSIFPTMTDHVNMVRFASKDERLFIHVAGRLWSLLQDEYASPPAYAAHSW